MAPVLSARAGRLAMIALAAAVLSAGGGNSERDAGAPPSRASAPSAPAAVRTTASCRGAVARDPRRPPCTDRRSRYSGTPAPDLAILEPTMLCTPVPHSTPEVCAFGVPAGRAAATVAIVGDSHAAHWIPALERVARARRWRALSLYKSRCPLTTALKST